MIRSTQHVTIVGCRYRYWYLGILDSLHCLLIRLSSLAHRLVDSLPLHRKPFRWVLLFLCGVFLLNRSFGCSRHAIMENDALDHMYNILVCGGPDLVGWHLNAEERLIMFVLGMVSVFAMVVPKFRTKDGAARHYVTIQASFTLFLHIATGLVTLILSALMGILDGGFHPESPASVLALSILVVVDLIHEATIMTMVKNHDGIFALRIGNFFGFYSKAITIINLPHLHYDYPYVTDLIFLQSNGFMGARLAAVLYASYMVWNRQGGGLFAEHHYSLGVSLTQFHIAIRLPHGISMCILLAPLVSYCYYHELWSRKYRLPFVAMNLLGSILAVSFLPKVLQIVYMMAYYLVCFFFTPVYYRRPDLTVAASAADANHFYSDDKNSRSLLRSIYYRTNAAQNDESDQDSALRMVRSSATLHNTLSQKDKAGFTFGRAAVWIPSFATVPDLVHERGTDGLQSERQATTIH